MEILDLGLPSGVLWGSCNLGAECPKDPGDFFAWGERSSKGEFLYENYGFRHRMDIKPKEDVASILLGPSWHLPTAAQIRELVEGCKWHYSCFFKRPYVKGVSKYNQQTICLPLVGYMVNSNVKKDLTGYLSSSLGSLSPDYSFGISIRKFDKIVETGYLYRTYGYFVRPVYQ